MEEFQIERVGMSPKDPNFWGLWGEEDKKKDTVETLNSWWVETKEELPYNMPRSAGIGKVLDSFHAKIEEINGIETPSLTDVSIQGSVYVDPKSVYMLLGQHYNCSPEIVREKYFEVFQ